MSIAASIFTDFWNDQLVAHDRQALFLVLVGFLGSFGFIRLSTRLMRSPRVPWWPGSIVSDGGVHLHHLVFGITLMMLTGSLGFALFGSSPWFEICALAFGIGTGLTIDEFALFVYLDDVYWAREGRTSIDATVIGGALLGIILLGINPFNVEAGTPLDAIVSVLALSLVLVVVSICFFKGRIMHGMVGLVTGFVAVYGACRIGKPDSPWGRRFYGERNPAKQAKAEARFRPGRRTERFKERFRDLVGGITEEEYKAQLAAKSTEADGTLDATAQLRERADRVAAEENRS